MYQFDSFVWYGTSFFVRFLHENHKQLQVYNALHKVLPQFSKDFSEFQEEPEEIEGFAKLVQFAVFY